MPHNRFRALTFVPWRSLPSITALALKKAYASIPGFRPRTLALSFVMTEQTVSPPLRERVTSVLTAPFRSSTIFPRNTFRALTRIVTLLRRE